jgi:hypothetical protein
MTMVADLEDFADQCSGIADDFDSALPADRATLVHRLPDVPRWHADQSWNTLPSGDVDGLLSLGLRSRIANSYVRSAVRFAEPADVSEAVRDEAVLLGASAWQLAQSLRRDRGFGPLRIRNSFGADLLHRVDTLSRKWGGRIATGIDPR